MSVAQINARLESSVKRAGDETLAQFGVGATEAIRALWGYLASARRLPDYMTQRHGRTRALSLSPAVSDEGATATTVKGNVGEDGAGLALRLAAEQGLCVEEPLDMPFEDLRELAFDELVMEGRAHA